LLEEAVADPTPGTVLVVVEHLSIDSFIRAALEESTQLELFDGSHIAKLLLKMWAAGAAALRGRSSGRAT
jgi:hypothetical protein